MSAAALTTLHRDTMEDKQQATALAAFIKRTAGSVHLRAYADGWYMACAGTRFAVVRLMCTVDPETKMLEYLWQPHETPSGTQITRTDIREVCDWCSVSTAYQRLKAVGVEVDPKRSTARQPAKGGQVGARLPADVVAKLDWLTVVYGTRTRAIIESINHHHDDEQA